MRWFPGLFSLIVLMAVTAREGWLLGFVGWSIGGAVMLTGVAFALALLVCWAFERIKGAS
jgi:hypothetical protein